MARGMWLEHPEAQDMAVGYAHQLRELAAIMPAGVERETVEDAATFLGQISDPDAAPRTEQEWRDAAAWRAANPGEVERRKRNMLAYVGAVEWASAAIAERDAQDANESGRPADAAE